MNMCHKEEPLNSIPYFWTAVFGKSFRYCGKYTLVYNTFETPVRDCGLVSQSKNQPGHQDPL